MEQEVTDERGVKMVFNKIDRRQFPRVMVKHCRWKRHMSPPLSQVFSWLVDVIWSHCCFPPGMQIGVWRSKRCSPCFASAQKKSSGPTVNHLTTCCFQAKNWSKTSTNHWNFLGENQWGVGSCETFAMATNSPGIPVPSKHPLWAASWSGEGTECNLWINKLQGTELCQEDGWRWRSEVELPGAQNSETITLTWRHPPLFNRNIPKFGCTLPMASPKSSQFVVTSLAQGWGIKIDIPFFHTPSASSCHDVSVNLIW